MDAFSEGRDLRDIGEGEEGSIRFATRLDCIFGSFASFCDSSLIGETR